MSKLSKLILAVPDKVSGLKIGFDLCNDGVIFSKLQQAGGWFGPRGNLEENPEFLQLIPYVVLVHGQKVVRYRRTKSGGDARLHESFSVGAGGHIDIEDYTEVDGVFSIRATLEKAATRELKEEFSLTAENVTWFGTIFDPSNEVGRVHLGVVGFVNIDFPVVAAEDELDSVELIGLNELNPKDPRWETWSALVIPTLIGRI